MFCIFGVSLRLWLLFSHQAISKNFSSDFLIRRIFVYNTPKAHGFELKQILV